MPETLPEPLLWALDEAGRWFTRPLRDENRAYWAFLLASVALAACVYARAGTGASRGGPVGFLRYLFPRRIYAHPSSVLDYKLFCANAFLTPLLVRATRIGGTSVIAAAVAAGLGGAFAMPAWDLGALRIPLFTLAFAAASDFANFANHILHHRVAILWPLHSLHHSAQVLNPLTLYRKHPLYDAVQGLVKTPLAGALQGVILFAFLGDPGMATILGMNAAFALFHFMGSNLRHTHVWLSFGPALEHVFVSPAQHQIHHSVRPELRNTNYGEIFALWDWMFGTLTVATPEIRDTLVLGIDAEGTQPHATLARAYAEPLQRVGDALRGVFARRARTAS